MRVTWAVPGCCSRAVDKRYVRGRGISDIFLELPLVALPNDDILCMSLELKAMNKAKALSMSSKPAISTEAMHDQRM